VKRFRPTSFDMIGDDKCSIWEVNGSWWVVGVYTITWLYWSDGRWVDEVDRATKFATPEEAESAFLGEVEETMSRSITL
jgi:hypothetical protein